MAGFVDLECVRRAVLETLPQLGMADCTRLRETALLGDLDLPGRRFQCDQIRAVWFVDSPVINFFSEDGEMLIAVSLETQATPQPAAA